MTPLVPIVMFGWIPVVFGIFTKFEPRRAVIVAFLSAWMFLPIAQYPLPGLPDYTKMSATCMGIFMAAFVFDQKRILFFRPSMADMPVFLWCVCPLISSLTNGLGLYDGLATFLRYVFTWGFPYLVGRLYFSDLEGLRAFAIGMLWGGLVYVPLCLLENVLSPQLHRWVYGFHQNSFAQTFRWGGWRPMVFMNHGLMVGVWMVSAALICYWFWASGALKKIGGIPIKWCLAALLITSVMARSTGALFLLLVGVCVIYIVKKLRTTLLVACLVIIPFVYVGTRATGIWDGYNLQAFIAENISYDRALSLWTRMENENILAEKAFQRPLFGWGGWGRNRVFDEEGNDISVTDGLWIIIFGQNGLVGLGMFMLFLLLPVVHFIRCYPSAQWIHRRVAPGGVLAILLCLYMVDNLLNAMINPIFAVIAGGLTGIRRESLSEDSFSPDSKSKQFQTLSCEPRFL